MEEMIQTLFTTYLVPAVVTCVGAIFSWIGVTLKNKYTEKVNTVEKQKIIDATVKYVDQVFNTLDGKSKLDEATKTASEWLSQKNIPVSEAELRVLIESAVNSLHSGFTTTTIAECSVEESKEGE